MTLTRRHLLTACSVLPMAACAAQAPSGCSAAQVGSVPMRIERGALIVPVALNRLPVLMVLDTGAERTILEPDVAHELGFHENPAKLSRLYGVGGIMPARPDVTVPELVFGDLRFADLDVAVGDAPLHGPGTPVAGLVGADVFGPLDMDFDFARGQLALYQGSACGGEPLTWNQQTQRIPTYRHGHLTVVDVSLDGAKLTAVIDTGATRSVVLASAAERIGLPTDYMLNVPGSAGEGIGDLPMGMHVHRFGELRIGSTVFVDPILAVGERSMGDLDMLIGLDLLRLRRMWLSADGHGIYFRRA
jgi:predicted aspartyl protease